VSLTMSATSATPEPVAAAAVESLPTVLEGEAQSARGQWRTTRLTALRLSSSVAAAAVGFVAGVDSDTRDAAYGAAALFAVALLAEILLWVLKPDRDWYDGRALAESAKSLGWKYAAGGDPFPMTLSATGAENLFVGRMAELVSIHPRPRVAAVGEVLAPQLRAARAELLLKRRHAFMTGRVVDQQNWYAGKANAADDAATRWKIGLVVAEVAGVLSALLFAAGTISFDVGAIAAAALSGGAAWLTLKQYEQLSEAYAVTADELGVALSKLQLATTEEAWAVEVANAEDAISREHTLWRARRR
jgi:hypothetical protein